MDKTSSKSHHLKRRLIRLGLYIAICLILLFLLFVGLTLLGTFGEMPDRDEIRKVSNYTASEVYSADNYLLGRYYLENRTNTQFVITSYSIHYTKLYDGSGQGLDQMLRYGF